MQQTSQPNIVAKRSADAMMANDKLAHLLKIKLDEVDSGYSKMSMVIVEDMLNGHAICHGGMIFSLADTAFAYACNSRNAKTVALNCTINYAASAVLGDHLTATCQEVTLSGRTGVYDVMVTNQRAERIAMFRGTSYKTSSTVYEENT